jgi:spore maturation protein CgeB
LRTYQNRAELLQGVRGIPQRGEPPAIQVSESNRQPVAGPAPGQAKPRVLVIEENTEIWHRTLPAGLRQVGCPVAFDTEVLEEDLERKMVEFQPDFVLMMGWTQTHIPARRKVIRGLLDRYRVPLVYWAVEDIDWLEHWSLPLVRDLQPDLVVTINAECTPRYKAEGFSAGYLPFGCNPELHRKMESRPEYQCDIALVANYYPLDNTGFRKQSLADLVAPLLERGYNLKIWGNRWDRATEVGLQVPEGLLQGPLAYDECAAVYSNAKIVLGLQNNLSPTQFTMRTFEVMGSGGLLLTSDTPAVRNLFKHGRQLLTSNSPERTLELVEYYLANERERAAIAAAGQEEVYARHTYAERAWGLLGLLETGGE